MRPGSVVRLKTDGSIGIVISQYKDVLNILCSDYKVISTSILNAEKTGKYFDLNIIWETVT